MKEYIDTMVADAELEKKDKISLLNEWETKVNDKIFSGAILDSDEFHRLSAGIEHIKSVRTKLQAQPA